MVKEGVHRCLPPVPAPWRGLFSNSSKARVLPETFDVVLRRNALPSTGVAKLMRPPLPSHGRNLPENEVNTEENKTKRWKDFSCYHLISGLSYA